MDNHPRWRILGYYLRWGIVVSINPNRSRLAQGFPAVLIPCLAAVSLAGCVDKRGGPIPYNVASFGVPDSPTVVPLETGGIVIAGGRFDSTVATVTASGGIPGHVYRLNNTVVLASGLSDSRSIVLRVEQR